MTDSTVLEQFEPFPRPKGVGGRNAKYPWGRWFDGTARELVAGRDFDGKLSSFVHAIRREARHRGVKVKLSQSREREAVRFVAILEGRS